jgi:signal transduction histidine kinase
VLDGSGSTVDRYDDLPDGVIVADVDGDVVSVNPAAGRSLGSDPIGLLGRPLVEVLPLIDPQGRDWWACTRPFDGLRIRVRQPERELTLTRPGLADQALLVTASYVRDADHTLRRVVVCLRGTTARSRQERSGAELVSVVAHELRSPLTSVKGFTSTLLTKWDRFTDEQRRHMLATVNSDADRVTRLITELLDVSRIETGRLELRKQVVDVGEIARRDIAARVAAGEADTRFVVVEAKGIGEVWGDPDKLAQVVGNLVENALRHGEGTVSVAVVPDGDGVRLDVSDEGAGIAAEALPRVFTKFWRGNRRGGTGLGLYIAKGIVDAHGGRIEAGCSAEGGAKVGFVLPAGTPSFAR